MTIIYIQLENKKKQVNLLRQLLETSTVMWHECTRLANLANVKHGADAIKYDQNRVDTLLSSCLQTTDAAFCEGYTKLLQQLALPAFIANIAAPPST